MAAVLMSNPLHLAVLGNPKRKKASSTKRRRKVAHKRKTKSKESAMAKRRNPNYKKGKARRTVAKRKSYKAKRRNPNITAQGKQYVGGLAGTPGKVMNLFKGKNALRNSAFVAGGAVGLTLLGGIVGRPIGRLIGRTPLADTFIGNRVIPALIPYTIGFVGSKFVKKNKNLSMAMQVGGGIASIITLVNPTLMGNLIDRIPGMSNIRAQIPMADAAANGPSAEAQNGIGEAMMLAGYVDAPSYAGTAGYVDAPGYSGTAGLGQEMLADYVSAPGYSGTAGYVDAPGYSGTAGLGQEMLAGSYLEDSIFQPAI